MKDGDILARKSGYIFGTFLACRKVILISFIYATFNILFFMDFINTYTGVTFMYCWTPWVPVGTCELFSWYFKFLFILETTF